MSSVDYDDEDLLHIPLLTRSLATIRSLPFEIVIETVEIGCRAARAEHHEPESRFAIPLTYSTLCSSALICREWVAPCTALLHQNIHLPTEKHARLLLSSASFGCYRTQRLAIAGGYGQSVRVPEAVAGRILSRVQNLRHLELWCFTGSNALDPRSLCKLNLSGVTQLHLEFVEFKLLPSCNPLSILFTLDFLHVLGAGDLDGNLFFQLIPTSPKLLYLQPMALTYVALSSSQINDLSELMRGVGRGVKTLIAHDYLDQWIPNLIPQFSGFTQLVNLELACDWRRVVEVLKILPSKLESLTIDVLNHNLNNLLQTMDSMEAISCLSNLVKLNLQVGNSSSTKALERFVGEATGRAFAEKLEKRGVELVLLSSLKVSDDWRLGKF